jgi:hypothetical protein
MSVYALPELSAATVSVPVVLDLASQVMKTLFHPNHDPDFRAKLCAVKATEYTVRAMERDRITTLLTELYASYTVITGERPADESEQGVWDEQLNWEVDAALQPICGLMGADQWTQILGPEWQGYFETGACDDIADALSATVSAHVTQSSATDYGKFLSKIGIAKKHLAGLVALAKQTPPAAAPDTKPIVGGTEIVVGRGGKPIVDGTEIVVGRDGKTISHTNPGDSLVSTAEHRQMEAIPPGKPPTKAELTKAFKLMYESGGLDVASVAKALEISAGTFRNYYQGNTPPKVNHVQAVRLCAMLQKCIDDLDTAYAIFARVP